jgi:hypothetical protein
MIRHDGGPLPSATHQQALVVRPPEPVEACQIMCDDSGRKKADILRVG